MIYSQNKFLLSDWEAWESFVQASRRWRRISTANTMDWLKISFAKRFGVVLILGDFFYPLTYKDSQLYRQCMASSPARRDCHQPDCRPFSASPQPGWPGTPQWTCHNLPPVFVIQSSSLPLPNAFDWISVRCPWRWSNIHSWLIKISISQLI